MNVLLQDGTQIDMEMQVAPFRYWDARALFYLCGLFTGQLGKGDPYSQLKRCIHVSILDFIHFPEDTECCHRISLFDKTTGQRYTDLMELRILELKKTSCPDRGGEYADQLDAVFCRKNQEGDEDGGADR